MNTRRVSECVLTHDRFVRLNRDSENRTYHTTGVANFLRIYVCTDLVVIGPSFDSHNHFFESCVTRTLAESVDTAFNLPSTVFDCSKRVGRRHAQIVVTVDTDHSLIDIRHVVFDAFDQSTKLLRS